MKEADLRITVRRENKTCQQYRGNKILARYERIKEGAKERRSEGAKERRSEGAKERRSEGA